MKVIVLGAGVIGVASAYYLAKAGHEVTVIERQPGVALETSYANAGEISPGYAAPWASPGIPMKALRWLFMKHPPLILRPQFDLATIRWLFATLRNCTQARYAVNKSRMLRLAEYSLECLIALRGETGIDYDQRAKGTLQLFRTQQQLDGIAKDIAVLEADNVPYEVLDAAGCVRAEPGLAHSAVPLAGGLRLPHDETGDCYIFTRALADIAAGLGVAFRFDTAIQELRAETGRITGVVTDKGDFTADAYVVALGSYSTRMLKPLGLRLPVYPVKGYSITVPVTAPERAPVSTLLDESYKVAITRLGDRIRVGGMAEIAGFNNDLHPRRRETLEHSVSSLFPGAGALSDATFWSGLRPMTPDGTPIVGGTRYPNLYLGTGHGTLGWTMACGTGRVIADLVTGARPEIDVGDLGLARYR